MKKNKGFTLIELMVVIAIIAIIAAIAIPNLLQARIRANETMAITVVKQYGTAQVIFQRGGEGAYNGGGTNTTAGNVYADNFRNLFYGTITGTVGVGNTVLRLISQAHADAYANGANDGGLGAATVAPILATSGVNGITAAPVPYQGYLFMTPTAIGGVGFFAGNYAHLALPVNTSATGRNAYWCGQEGNVQTRALQANQATAALLTGGAGADAGVDSTSPSTPGAIAGGWTSGL